jgi:hypothetical protein
MKHLFLFLLLLLATSLKAQTFSGTVSDDKKHPIPYATVFVKELKLGTASNESGRFEIALGEGTYTITFQSLGYESQTRSILMKGVNQQVSVVLKERVYILKEVVVAGGKEDPAYAIMRKVIGFAPIYNRQVKSSETEVYLRGSLMVNKISKLTKWLGGEDLKKSKLEEGKTYLEESVNEVFYTYPNTIRQVVKSLHSTIPPQAGRQGRNMINIGYGSVYDPNYFNQNVRSPLAPGAFSFYTFRYEGYQEEGDHIINKIRIIPKGNGAQYLKGYLYIVDKLWCVHSFDLSGESTGVKNYRIQQLFTSVNNEAWLPISDNFLWNFDIMGNQAIMVFHSTRKYRDIKINNFATAMLPVDATPAVKNAVVVVKKETKSVVKRDEKIKKLMEKEKPSSYEAFKMARLVMKQVDLDITDSIKKNHVAPRTRTTVIDSNAIKKDSTYWNAVRPIPLAANEAKSIVTYDSVKAVTRVRDSIDLTPKGKKIKLLRTVMMGGNFVSDTVRTWKFDGLINVGGIRFNSVDGWRYTLGSAFSKRYVNRNIFRVNGEMGYAIDRKAVLWNVQGAYIHNKGLNTLQLGAGRFTQDFNGGGATSLENQYSSLFFKQNLNRFYDKQTLWGQYGVTLATGLSMAGSVFYMDNAPLTNHSNYSFLYRNERSYSLNVPLNTDYMMSAHRNTVVGLDLRYTPGQNWYLRRNMKVFTASVYPTFSVIWRKGVPSLLGGETNYQFIRASVFQNLNLGNSVNLEYVVSAGVFPGRKPVYFSEFNHFAAQPLTVGVKGFLNTFQLLDYYRYSTNDRFVEGHVGYSTPYLLLKRLPLIRDRVWTEKAMINYLYTPVLGHYTEVGYAIGNELYNIGVFGSFRGLNGDRVGVKVSLRIFNRIPGNITL